MFLVVAEIKGLVMHRVTKCHWPGFHINPFVQTVIRPTHFLAAHFKNLALLSSLHFCVKLKLDFSVVTELTATEGKTMVRYVMLGLF